MAGISKGPEGPRTAWKRVAQATDVLLASFRETDALILVSHGWFITVLTLYLRKHGLIERGPFRPNVNHFGGMTEYDIRVAR